MTVRFVRNRALLHVSDQLLEQLLRLPDDVTIRGFTLDHIRAAATFILESDRFAPVAECAEPPALIGKFESEVADDGTVTQRITWEGLDTVEIVTRHAPPADPDVYRSRTTTTVRARQWLAGNEAYVQELTGSDFFALSQPADEDPDATASLLTAPHNTWVLVHDSDWVVQRGDGWMRMTDEEFVAEYEPAS